MGSKKYFNNVAEDWDKMRESFFSVQLRDKVISLAQIHKGAIIADIGAGSGFITEGLVELAVKKIIAVDQSEKMLEIVRRKFPDTNTLELRLGESEKLPFSDNEIDCAFANMYLHHVEDPQLSIAELFRILKPGGKLLISDINSHNHEFMRDEQCDRWLGFNKADIENWYTKVGFKDISVTNANESCCTKKDDCSELAEICIFIAIGQK